jgi:hypothetical protein
MISGIGGSSSLAQLLGTGGDLAATGTRPRGGGPGALTLRTNEGDTVTITMKSPQSVTYGRPAGGSLAALGLQSNDQFDVSIQGNLSDQERSDIQATLQKMDSAKASLESGDFAGGMSAMQDALKGGGTVQSVSGPGRMAPPTGMLSSSGTGGSEGSIVSLFDSKSSDDKTSSKSSQKVSSSHHDTSLDDFVRKALAGLNSPNTQASQQNE